MAPIDLNNDPQRLLDTLAQGGVALFPTDVGYTIVGNKARTKTPCATSAGVTPTWSAPTT